MTLKHLLLLCCFIWTVSGCSKDERNYSRNLQFFRNLRIDGQSQNVFDAARLQHLESITPDKLVRPVIFLAFISNPPSEERKGTIDIHWSEKSFRQYLLVVRSGTSEIAKLKAVFTSEDSKSMGQEENFEFVVHEASYPLSKQILDRIRRYEDEGKQIEILLKRSDSGMKSKPLSWDQVRHSLRKDN